MTPTDIIETLLALVAPHCSLCHRPALTAKREEGPDQMAPGIYRCQVHPCSEGRWSELPGRAAIEAASALVEAERNP